MSSTGFPSLVNGRLHPPGAGTISVDDPGFLLGLSVFETLLYEHGCVHFLERHLARLDQGLRALSIELPPERDPTRDLDAYRPALDARLAELGETRAAVRLTISRGVPDADGRARPTVVLGARQVAPPPKDGVVVTWEPRAKHSGDALEELKTTNRARNVLARERALERGAWDALLGNEMEHVCEATIANVWAVIEDVVVTPGLESGCLGGVTRELLLTEVEQAGYELRVGPLPVADLPRASEIFLSNSTGRTIPVNAVLGVVDGLQGPEGPVSSTLRAALARCEAAYREAR